MSCFCGWMFTQIQHNVNNGAFLQKYKDFNKFTKNKTILQVNSERQASRRWKQIAIKFPEYSYLEATRGTALSWDDMDKLKSGQKLEDVLSESTTYGQANDDNDFEMESIQQAPSKDNTSSRDQNESNHNKSNHNQPHQKQSSGNQPESQQSNLSNSSSSSSGSSSSSSSSSQQSSITEFANSNDSDYKPSKSLVFFPSY